MQPISGLAKIHKYPKILGKKPYPEGQNRFFGGIWCHFYEFVKKYDFYYTNMTKDIPNNNCLNYFTLQQVLISDTKPTLIWHSN